MRAFMKASFNLLIPIMKSIWFEVCSNENKLCAFKNGFVNCHFFLKWIIRRLNKDCDLKNSKFSLIDIIFFSKQLFSPFVLVFYYSKLKALLSQYIYLLLIRNTHTFQNSSLLRILTFSHWRQKGEHLSPSVVNDFLHYVFIWQTIRFSWFFSQSAWNFTRARFIFIDWICWLRFSTSMKVF